MVCNYLYCEMKKGVFSMYILSILAIIVSVVLMSCCSLNVNIMSYIDVVSLMVILLISIPVLISAGLGKDFNRAFGFTLGNRKADSLVSLKRAKEAVELVRKTMIYSGIFAGVFSAICVLNQTGDMSKIGLNIAVCLITILYGVAINILLLPISAKLEVKIAEYMHK